MKTVTEFPRKVIEFPDWGIVMSDGCRLSARIRMPGDADQRPVPAILEHLPHRKRGGTADRDASGRSAVGTWRGALDTDAVAKGMVRAHGNLQLHAVRRGEFPSDRAHRGL